MRHRTPAVADPSENAAPHWVPFGVILLIPIFAVLTLVILTLLLGIFVLWLCAVAGLFLSIFLADVVEGWTQRLSRPQIGALARRPVRVPGR